MGMALGKNPRRKPSLQWRKSNDAYSIPPTQLPSISIPSQLPFLPFSNIIFPAFELRFSSVLRDPKFPPLIFSVQLSFLFFPILPWKQLLSFKTSNSFAWSPLSHFACGAFAVITSAFRLNRFRGIGNFDLRLSDFGPFCSFSNFCTQEIVTRNKSEIAPSPFEYKMLHQPIHKVSIVGNDN